MASMSWDVGRPVGEPGAGVGLYDAVGSRSEGRAVLGIRNVGGMNAVGRELEFTHVFVLLQGVQKVC